MTIPKSYEALAADLASEKIISKTLLGQKEAYMMLADKGRLDLSESKAREAALRESLTDKRDEYNKLGDRYDALQQRLTVAEKNEKHWRGVASEVTCRAASLNDQVQELELENADLKSGMLTILQSSDRTAEMLSGTNDSSKDKDKSGNAPKGPFPPGPHIDQQGYKIKIGVAYRFVFGMPGPDVTSVIVESFNDDGSVNVFDPSFKIKAENLGSGRFWRPLMRGWDDISDRKAIVEYAGESALDLTP